VSELRSPRPDERSGGASPLSSALRAHVYSGTQLAVSVLLGLGVGRYLDKRLGWSPWLTLLGAALGFAVGIYGFLKPYFQRDDPPK
jgi:F0F1-type ATP synthase assembly protein I